jgi:hypothetical protein
MIWILQNYGRLLVFYANKRHNNLVIYHNPYEIFLLNRDT